MSTLQKHLLVKYKTASGLEKFRIVYKQSLHYHDENNNMIPITESENWSQYLVYSVNGEKLLGPITIIDNDDTMSELRERNQHLASGRIPVDKRNSLTPIDDPRKRDKIPKKKSKNTVSSVRSN
ncbi:hypothetical protein KQX54_012374 [Cotesia glomerata]|uniref:Uncharacterized protein n=1 Tax=Cotesia glomerata TaxID=32391 RepID=A0AAV7HZQ8_COTGL|nr:hypothetical protein KQX54_012374 [Cotesia glomerata]